MRKERTPATLMSKNIIILLASLIPSLSNATPIKLVCDGAILDEARIGNGAIMFEIRQDKEQLVTSTPLPTFGYLRANLTTATDSYYGTHTVNPPIMFRGMQVDSLFIRIDRYEAAAAIFTNFDKEGHGWAIFMGDDNSCAVAKARF